MEFSREIRARAGRPAGPWRWIGATMLLHAALLATLKISRDVPGEMLWASHAGLVLGGLGLLLNSSRLAATAFVLVAIMHGVWLFDAAVGILSGKFPLGLASYLAEADWMIAAGTCHHVYLAPVLALRLARGGTARGALWSAAAVLAMLTGLSRAFLPATLNVNFAHAVMPTSTLNAFVWFNGLPWWVYLPIHIGVCAALALAPGAMLLGWIAHDRPIRERIEHTVKDQAVSSRARACRAFTLIELIAVLVVLAVLSAVAIPKYIDYSGKAKDSADGASAAGINTALKTAFLQHRLNNTPGSQWVLAVEDIAACMEGGALPYGITIESGLLKDQRGNSYAFSEETDEEPARIVMIAGSTGS